ncbi:MULTISPECIES: glycerophosphodiester phosphodiesterase [Halorubrum]|uniref:Glycerophosphoryl diester phosphodiesterase n=1 Tax=Halorubrum hochstenium ATCC 700873 TaxID=1227481 RepID=M0FF86_9EURY|nr:MULTISPECIES: glycerophosphodiester phosphodiesterase family protein [Halorubrum]ELZ58590.1 glycerophosphoryl diester phosphodiesterase [Halorubrum hochstenium ATCC 700873]
MNDAESSGSDGYSRSTRRAALRRGGSLGVGALATTAGCVGREGEAGEAHGQRDGSDPPLIAHRGFAAENPENTVAAVEAATAAVDRVELDVRRCGTGELVAFHDATLGRVTDATGRVEETAYDRLAGLSVEDSGEPVATLAAALDAVPADAWVMLDLKERGIAADALAVAADRDHDLAVAADDPAVLEAVRAADPTVATVYGVRESVPARVLRPLVSGRLGGAGLPRWAYPPQDAAGAVETATALGCAAVSPRYELCLRTDLVPRARDADLRVFPWTIGSEREYEAVAGAGVDAVVSDVARGPSEK